MYSYRDDFAAAKCDKEKVAKFHSILAQMRFSMPLINVQIEFYQGLTKAQQLNATDRLRLSIFAGKTASASGGWLSSLEGNGTNRLMAATQMRCRCFIVASEISAGSSWD
jgi:hypothetical protein